MCSETESKRKESRNIWEKNNLTKERVKRKKSCKGMVKQSLAKKRLADINRSQLLIVRTIGEEASRASQKFSNLRPQRAELVQELASVLPRNILGFYSLLSAKL
jgi:hypothetical protein